MRSVYVTTRTFIDGSDTKQMNSRKQAVGRARKAPLFGQALEAQVDLIEYAPSRTLTGEIVEGSEIEVNRKTVYKRDFTAPTATPASELPPSTIAKKAASFGYGPSTY